ALGLERDDKIGIISGNRPAWLYTELAAQAIGAIPLGVFADTLPEHVQALLEYSEARFVLVEDQEQADKVLGVRAALARLERILVDDRRGLEPRPASMLISLEAVERRGREVDAREPGRYDALLERGQPDDVALLLYPSGTTGAGKAAMLSHRNLLAAA